MQLKHKLISFVLAATKAFPVETRNDRLTKLDNAVTVMTVTGLSARIKAKHRSIRRKSSNLCSSAKRNNKYNGYTEQCT